MAVSSTTGGLRTGVCLSTDRPQNPYNGQVIYETDTNRTLVWDNSAWVVVADPALVSFSGSAASVTGNLTGNVTGNVTGDLTGDVAASAVTIGGENMTPYTGRRNLIYNGAMNVAQRGTSVAGITSGGYRTVDRWITGISSLGTWTESVENDAPTGSGFSKSWKMLCTTADAAPASNNYCFVRQKLEGQDLQQIKKGTSSAESLTISFWVKSNVTGTHIVGLIDIDNNRQVSASYSVVASGTWEKKTVTFPPDTSGAFDNDNSDSLHLYFWLGAGSDYTSGTLDTTWATATAVNRAAGQTNVAAATSNYWQVTGVQLEVGDKATPFEHRSYGEELTLCQRYYHQGGSTTVSGLIGASNYADVSTVFFPTAMRAAPSVTVYRSGVAGQMYATWGSGGFGNLTGWGTSGLHNYGFTQYRYFGSGAGAAVRAFMDYYVASAEL